GALPNLAHESRAVLFVRGSEPCVQRLGLGARGDEEGEAAVLGKQFDDIRDDVLEGARTHLVLANEIEFVLQEHVESALVVRAEQRLSDLRKLESLHGFIATSESARAHASAVKWVLFTFPTKFTPASTTRPSPASS